MKKTSSLLKETLIDEIILKFSQILAPHIIGNEVAKTFSFLQVFSNPLYPFLENFHVLFVGGPASGKSEIAKDVNRLTERSVLISPNSTSAGVVGAMRGGRLVGGSFYKANGGVIVAEDFQEHPSEVKERLLEILQDKTVTISKSGRYIEKNVFSNFLFTMNPVYGEWEEPDISEINLSPQLVSRIHFIVPFKTPEKKQYKRIGGNLKYKDEMLEDENRKAHFNSYIDESLKILNVSMERGLYESIGDFVGAMKDKYEAFYPINPRTTEGMVSLCKAFARMNRRDSVDLEDVELAKILFEKLLKMWK